MSLLDNASLLLTPNAYKEGKLYSVIPSNGNGDFTATRATTATRVNSAGLVDLVPYNLLQYSEQFENAVWVKEFATISSNATTAPNGTLTADKLQEDNTTNKHDFFFSGGIASLVGQTYTISIYAKAAERDYMQIALGTGNVTGNPRVNFNLSNGTITAVDSGITATIESAANGFYRCNLTVTAALTYLTFVVQTQTLGTAARFATYLGTTGSGIFTWGAQIVEGTSARDYLRTETRLNIPRVDYSLGGCPNILLEPQRTNLALQSSSFDSVSWSKTASSVTANTTTSPSGIVDADTLTADGTPAIHYIQSSSFSATSGATYTTSFYAKKNTNNFVQVWMSNGVGGMFANFDLNNGVVGTLGTNTGTAPTSAITSVGNGWYRCSITFTSTATANATALFLITTSASSSRAEANTLSTSVFLWGAQVEAGAYATSYIPTTTASVTRNADGITRNNIFTNGLITAAGGTWFVEIRNNVAKVRDSAGALYFGVNANTCFRIRNISSALSRVTIDKNIAGVPSNLFTTTTDIVKLAIKWDGSTADVFANGVKVVTATAFAFTALEELTSSAGIPLYINEMALFPTPLTDDQCIALTQ